MHQFLCTKIVSIYKNFIDKQEKPKLKHRKLEFVFSLKTFMTRWVCPGTVSKEPLGNAERLGMTFKTIK